jgi:Cof subfamily protein (haloacid dehalogenase superfamily)
MSNPPNPKTIKALAMDLDGTILAPGATLTERTIRAVNKCRQLGLGIIITTGRAIEAAEFYRAPLGAEGPMIYYNGAVVAEMPGVKILKTTLLERKAVEFCVELSRETGVYCQVYFYDEDTGGSNHNRIVLFAEKDCPEREMYHKHTGILPELVDLIKVLNQYKPKSCVKIMFLAEPEVQAALRPRLDEHFGESVYIAQTTRTFLEITDKMASKGHGLNFAMEKLSLKSEEVIAFGDEENDLPMFTVVGFSVAPSNAKEQVKARADMVVGSNAENGVAVFLEEFFGF